MHFTYPYILWFLLLAVIPILIHLFNFQRFKPVYFSKVFLLQNLQSETKRKQKLKEILLLALRVLCIIAMVVAFAQPYIPKGNTQQGKKNAVVVYVDNSFSMEASGSRSSLIESAREEAKQLINLYNADDVFMLLSNDLSAEHSRFVSRDEMLKYLDELQISSHWRSIKEIETYAEQAFASQNSANKVLFVLSDFQQNATELAPLNNVSTHLLPLVAEAKANLYIDSCWFPTPVFRQGNEVQLSVRVVNSSSEKKEQVPLKLFLNNQQKAVAAVSVDENNSADITLNFSLTADRFYNAFVEIDDEEITFDNRLYFSFAINHLAEVVVIDEGKESPYLNALFSADTASFVYHRFPAKGVDYTLFNRASLVVLNGVQEFSSGLLQALTDFVSNGGNLLIFPPENMVYENYLNLQNQFDLPRWTAIDTARTRIGKIELNHVLYKNVFDNVSDNIDLPAVMRHYVATTADNAEVLLQTERNNAFLTCSPYQGGNIFCCASPLNTTWSAFPLHSLFVPTLYNMAMQNNLQTNLYYTIGKNEMIMVFANRGNDNVVTIAGNNMECIPEIQPAGQELHLFEHAQVREAGNYTVLLQNDTLACLSFNYDRKESPMQFCSASDLADIIKENNLQNTSVFEGTTSGFAKSLEALNSRQLWLWFVLLALVCLLGESVLIRWWK